MRERAAKEKAYNDSLNSALQLKNLKMLKKMLKKMWRSWSRHRSASCATRVRFPGSVEHWQCSIVAVNSLSSSCPPPKVQFRLSLIKELVHFVEKGSRR